MESYWQLGDELRGQSKVSEDQKWYAAASRLAEQTRLKGERRNNLDLSKFSADTTRPRENATTFGGSNIDPTAWEDKKCKGESRFPAQVRIRIRKVCKALEEDAFRPVLHHYDGPKFRLELSIPETLDLLDLCEQNGV
ncbi:Development/cell death domain-containing protein [Cynara cardunculus var. scolymus]|uniref:Development/cell death domain-containing protein n=1 Tax=Cynara cardunculus var. scolymus TaxID=59895 RepID=A0A124SC65_CYNCS|nr:Development/cell death domain-containing protein [Cynara cardunculus var. scolymus]